MPNWCHNTLTVEGSERELKRFSERVSQPQHEDYADGSPLYFSSLVPEPVNEESDNGLIDDWYWWRVEHWGSKWEPNFGEPFLALGAPGADPSKENKGLSSREELSYKFDTAWSPPSPWVRQASRLFPSLRFTLSYGEPGNDFAGREVFISGQVVEAEELAVTEVLSRSEMWF